jgi:MinD superfamily P-loop ATPase
MNRTSHPEEIQRLMELHAEEMRVQGAEIEREPAYWCPRCERASARYMAKGATWHPARYECFGCGWWEPARSFEARVERLLGLGEAE